MRFAGIGLWLGLAVAVPAWGQASFYEGKTVTVSIPVAEQAKPRKVQITAGNGNGKAHAIEANAST